MSLLYEVRGLVRRYGRVTALDLPALGVDELRIHSGQVLTLVGYNGSGKSTLLRLLAFLEEPDEGRIIYHGGEDPRREVSLLLQEPYLLKTTVFENVVLGLKLRGRRDGLEDAYQAAMRQVGFDDPDAMRRRGPNALSGGERQRINIGRSLLCPFDMLLMDEPTKGLDNHFKRELAEILKRLQEHGVTIVMVSHDVEFCAQYADRCGLLFRGEVVTENDPRAFFSGNYFYTTAAARIARTAAPGAVLCEEVVQCLAD